MIRTPICCFNTISLLHTPLHKISVYSGISPSLLATLSLSQGVRGTDNKTLISSLSNRNILRNPTLISVMQEMERKYFIKGNNNINVYQNKPYRISGGQMMTDIFTHAVILQQITQLELAKENDLRVLDIGTGHGYLAYVIAQYLAQTKQQRNQTKVVGIDANQEAVNYCNQLKSKLSHIFHQQAVKNTQFINHTLEQHFSSASPYNIIIGGFYMPPNFHSLLQTHLLNSSRTLKTNTYGIWASDSQNGQTLYSFKSDGDKLHKRQIMSTMFSMPSVSSKVSKYFVEEGEQAESIEKEEIDQKKVREELKVLKLQRKKEEQEKIKGLLKEEILRHQKKLNRKLSLQQMKAIPEINILLEKLKK